jgi:membrane-associated protein
VGAGYAFGNVPIVKDNFTLVAAAIVVLSVLPMVVEYLRYRRTGHTPQAGPERRPAEHRVP